MTDYLIQTPSGFVQRANATTGVQLTTDATNARRFASLPAAESFARDWSDCGHGLSMRTLMIVPRSA